MSKSPSHGTQAIKSIASFIALVSRLLTTFDMSHFGNELNWEFKNVTKFDRYYSEHKKSGKTKQQLQTLFDDLSEEDKDKYANPPDEPAGKWVKTQKNQHLRICRFFGSKFFLSGFRQDSKDHGWLMEGTGKEGIVNAVLTFWFQMAYKDNEAYAKNVGTRTIEVENELILRTGNKYTLNLAFFDKLGGIEPFRDIVQRCIDNPETVVRGWLEEREYHNALQYYDVPLSDLPADHHLVIEYPLIVDPPPRREGPLLPKPSAVVPCAQGRKEKCQDRAASSKRKRSGVKCQNDNQDLPNSSNAVKVEPAAVEADLVGRQVDLRNGHVDACNAAVAPSILVGTAREASGEYRYGNVLSGGHKCFIDDWCNNFHGGCTEPASEQLMFINARMEPDIVQVELRTACTEMDVHLLDDLPELDEFGYKEILAPDVC
eukprot:CAMPEP_0181348808 /NCGR_PEP_ID=MMETSP1106-20121128/384_1 /TAXON_ID=81844 /ORGANISM="Mantoniella antarctica, Strain SL-175" /LENGTH=429 /DNA_ID=CAMNT_0023461147 /DNA_START=236 /DNA_END=1522 /DNA_ORIENTATION=+